MRYLWRYATVAAGIVLVVGCTASAMAGNEMKTTSSTRFFRNLDAKRLPFRPYDEVTEEETRNLEAFVRCEFDSHGRLQELEKFYKGRLYFTQQYEYYPNGRLREVVTQEFLPKLTPVRTERFDEEGHPVRTK